MAVANTIEIAARPVLGTASSRKIRVQGLVPVNVYGHGQESAFGTVSAEVALAIAKSGTKVVDLKVDSGADEKAIIREIQWDTFGTHVLHVDFLRIDAQQRITADVPLHLRGTAPGVLAGGTMEQPMHSVTIECLAVLVPAEIAVRVAAMQIGDTFHVSDLTELPEGASLVTPGDALICQVVAPRAPEADPAAPAPATTGA